MRNISFSLTTPQFRGRTKTVTRRLGWEKAKVGEILEGIEKGQGLKQGEKVVRMGKIRLLSVRRERLDRMISEPDYGKSEAIKEGFPEMSGVDFVGMFCKHNGCYEFTVITRLEFEYLD